MIDSFIKLIPRRIRFKMLVLLGKDLSVKIEVLVNKEIGRRIRWLLDLSRRDFIQQHSLFGWNWRRYHFRSSSYRKISL